TYTHRTIGEYLVARGVAAKLKNRSACEWEMIDKKAWDPQWKPVLLFLAGLLTDTPEALARYAKLCRKPETRPKRDDLLRHRLCLAAEVLAELPVPQLSLVREAKIVSRIFTRQLKRWPNDLQHLGTEEVRYIFPLYRALAQVSIGVSENGLMSFLLKE